MYQNNFWISVQENAIIYFQLFPEIILLFQNIPQFFSPLIIPNIIDARLFTVLIFGAEKYLQW